MEPTLIIIDLKDGRLVSLTALAGVSCPFMAGPGYVSEVGARMIIYFWSNADRLTEDFALMEALLRYCEDTSDISKSSVARRSSDRANGTREKGSGTFNHKWWVIIPLQFPLLVECHKYCNMLRRYLLRRYTLSLKRDANFGAI